MIGVIGGVLPASSVSGIMPIGPIQVTSPTQATGISGVESSENTVGNINFGQYLSDALGQVNSMQEASSQITDDFISGKTDSIHEVMIVGEKASLALQLVLEIRNKVLEAYQEINRMQI